MIYKYNKAYDIETSTKEYETTTCTTVDKNGKLVLIRNSAGDIQYRYSKLVNRVLSFWYLVEYKDTDSIERWQSNLEKAFNTVNSTSIVIAGRRIPKESAVILDVSYELQEIDNVDTRKSGLAWKVNMSIELTVEKPVYKDLLMSRSLFFKHDGNMYRIQFCSDQSQPYYKNGIKSSLDGYGFFDENRPDLNVSYEMPLDEDGDVASDSSKIAYTEVITKSLFNWKTLNIPDEIGGTTL